MPHPIFEINELVGQVIDELVETSPRTAVSFALTCRSLEEPSLSSLWKQQKSLTRLLMVLPSCTCVEDDYGDEVIAFEHDPSAKDWVRLQRYASWMRVLSLGPYDVFSSDPLFQLSSNLPGGLLFPKLEWLYWDIFEANTALPFFYLFLPPHLRHVVLSADDELSNIPELLLTPLVQIISLLPASLEYLSVMCAQGKDKPLQDAVSSLVCRCGPSLRNLQTCLPLSEAATRHLMQAPNLSHWTVAHRPPRVVPAYIFPSLDSIQLKPEALPWLHLLASHENDVLRNDSASSTSHTNVRETLKSLCCPRTTVDSTLLSSIVKFRNLVTLSMRTEYCFDMGQCAFRLTDDDVEKLAVALPSLKSLQFGQPCSFSTCNTTVASLMSMSVHCPDLTVLETHFNTRTIVNDMQHLLDGGGGRDKAKCKLQNLVVGCLPLEVHGEGIEVVAMGLRVIFPCLTGFKGYSGGWRQLESKLGD